MNQVALVGNITDDPELRYTQSGAALAGFTVAVSHRSKHNGEWQDVNDGFFRCTAWRSVGENAAHTLKKERDAGLRVQPAPRTNVLLRVMLDIEPPRVWWRLWSSPLFSLQTDWLQRVLSRPNNRQIVWRGGGTHPDRGADASGLISNDQHQEAIPQSYPFYVSGRVLNIAAAALVVAVAAGVVIGVTTSGSPDPVASLENLRDKGVLFLEDHHIFLVYNDGDPLALSDDPQHLDGEHTEWCESSQMFETPTHGEKFDHRGYYYAGPAMKGLDRYPVRVEGDALYVDLDELLPGPERGAEKPLEPEGPFCVFD